MGKYFFAVCTNDKVYNTHGIIDLLVRIDTNIIIESSMALCYKFLLRFKFRFQP